MRGCIIQEDKIIVRGHLVHADTVRRILTIAIEGKEFEVNPAEEYIVMTKPIYDRLVEAGNGEKENN